MKAKTLSLTAILLIFASVFTACNGDEPEIEIFPQEISFTEFSLRGSDCRWASFEAGKVIVINSTDELRDFILCREDGRFFHIDFSKYSFLLTRGSTESSIFFNDINFSKQAAKEYALDLTFHTDVSDLAQSWIIAGTVPKITSGANIALNTKELQDNTCAEVDLMGTKWKLVGVVNTETNAITTSATGNHDDFTIRFEPIRIGSRHYLFRAQVGTHTIWGNYEFNYNTCVYRFIPPMVSNSFEFIGFTGLVFMIVHSGDFFTLSNTQPRILLWRDRLDGILKYKELENEE